MNESTRQPSVPSIRWGLLGTARINRALIPAIRASARSALVAVASRDATRAELYAREWQIPRSLGSYESLLADSSVDAVYIPLPNSFHAEWTIKACEAGKHVLCEKPLALSVADVDRIIDAASRRNVVVAEGFMYRHHPQTAQVRDLVERGAIGSVRVVRGSFTFPLKSHANVRLDPALGGGSLWDVGCYPVSFARTIVGAEPQQVWGSSVTGPTGVDLAFTGVLEFGGDVRGSFDCGFNAHFRTEMEIVGTEGVLRLPRPFKPGRVGQIVLTRGDEVDTIQVDGPELYVGEIDDLASAVLDRRSPVVTLDDSRGNIATLAALHESARIRRPVPPWREESMGVSGPARKVTQS